MLRSPCRNVFSESLCQIQGGENSSLRTRRNIILGEGKITDFRLLRRRQAPPENFWEVTVSLQTFPFVLNDLGESCGAASCLISLSKLYAAYITKITKKNKKSLISRKSPQKSLISLNLRGTPPPRGWGVDKPLPEGVTLTGITFVSPFLSDITPM